MTTGEQTGDANKDLDRTVREITAHLARDFADVIQQTSAGEWSVWLKRAFEHAGVAFS